jgi:hypothetical protein
MIGLVEMSLAVRAVVFKCIYILVYLDRSTQLYSMHVQ